MAKSDAATSSAEASTHKPPSARELIVRSEGYSEPLKKRRKRAAAIDAALQKAYPDAHCELAHANPFQLVIATILSAQSTDVLVNKVTPVLFARYPDAPALAEADAAEVETLIKSTGFYRNKTKSIIGCAKTLVERHGGEVPRTMEALVELPGVARKTANVVLGTAFGINLGFVVDTHIQRLSQLMRLTDHSEPLKTERDLMEAFPGGDWAMIGHRLIFHGRRCCAAKKPDCSHCGVRRHCPSAGDIA